MHTSTIIESYIDDTVRLVPRRMRADVACELRSLLHEELNARMEQSVPENAPASDNEAARTEAALALVRSYGEPATVAARYHTPMTIIDPADTTSFLRAAIVGAVSLVLLAGACSQFASPSVKPDDIVKIGTLSWLGTLVVWYGVKGAMRRRWPERTKWKPRDRDRVHRLGNIAIVPFAVVGIVAYIAPVWTANLFNRMTGAKIDAPSLAYTDEFQQQRLPIFIGLLIALLAMLLFVTWRGRQSRVTRRIDLGLNFVLACVVLSFAVAGGVMRAPHADAIAQQVLTLIGVIYLPCIGAIALSEIGRLKGTHQSTLS